MVLIFLISFRSFYSNNRPLTSKTSVKKQKKHYIFIR